jgi:hypothetical protein
MEGIVIDQKERNSRTKRSTRQLPSPACLYQHSVCPFRRGMSLPTQPTSPSTRSVMQLRQHNNSTTTAQQQHNNNNKN